MTRALLLALLLLAAPAVASAAGPDAENPQAPKIEKTTADLLSDLESENPSDRLYAARVLRAHLRRSLRAEARGRVGTIAYDEARALLVELEARLPESCIAGLQVENLVAPCADMLAWLEVRDALPALAERRKTETRKRVIKRLDAALTTLGTPAEPAAPG